VTYPHNIADLETFARQFDTDKRADGPKANGYLPLYLAYFMAHGFDREAPLKILEVGTNKGSSLRMWAEYFKNAQVFGTDITRGYELPGMLEHPNITTDLVDQGDHTAMVEYGYHNGPWDIIIDDGSHRQDHIMITLGAMFQFVRPNGLFVIEDVITGENWLDGNTWNPTNDRPAREALIDMEASNTLVTPRIAAENLTAINASCEYCDYRESEVEYFPGHKSQIVFIGKTR